MDKERRETLVGMVEARVRAAEQELYDVLDKRLAANAPGEPPHYQISKAAEKHDQWWKIWHTLNPMEADKYAGKDVERLMELLEGIAKQLNQSE